MDIFSLNYPEDEDVQEVDSCLDDHYYASILNDGDQLPFVMKNRIA